MLLSARYFALFWLGMACAGEDQQPLAPVRTTVVVTASKSETELATAPAATSLVPAAEIQQRNAQFADQALAQTPGVYPLRAKGAMDTGAAIGMRGFSARSFSRVLVLLDGQPLNNAYAGGVTTAPIPIEEIDRMEVVRGPFSALYGGSAMGGVIHFLTRPIDRREVTAQAQYGTFRTMQYHARYAERFFDKLGISIGYQRLQSGGYPTSKVLLAGTNVTGPTAGSPIVPAPVLTRTNTGAATYIIGEQGDNWYNQYAIRGRAEYSWTDRTSLSGQYIGRQNAYGYDQSRSFLGPSLFRGNVFFNDGQWRRLTLRPGGFFTGPGETLQHMTNGQVLHSFANSSTLRISGGTVWSPYDFFTSPADQTAFDGAGGPGTFSDRPNRNSQAEVQWTLPRLARHSFTAGMEFRQQSNQALDFSVDDIATRIVPPIRNGYARGRASNAGAYAQDQFQPLEKLTLTLGGRFDYWRNTTGESQDRPGVPPQVFPSRSEHYFSGKAAAVYRLRPGSVVRASLGNAFRTPTLYDLFRVTFSGITQALSLPNPELQPESLWSWEVGARQYFGSRLSFDTAFYENRVNDLIYRSTDLVRDPSGRTSIVRNAGRAQTRGFEAGLEQKFSFLTLRQSYTFTDAKIVSNVAVPATVGKRVTQVPRSVATFQALFNRTRWNAMLAGRYYGKVFSNDTNADVVKGVQGGYDPFFETDATVTWLANRHWDVFFTVNNLLNRRYFSFWQTPGRTVTGGIRWRL